MRPQALSSYQGNNPGNSKVGYLVLAVIAVVVIAGVIWLRGRTDSEETAGTEPVDISNVGLSDDLDDSSADTTIDSDSTDDTDNSDSTTNSLTDFLQYSEEKQEVGGASSSDYALLSIEDSPGDGYHRFVFELDESEDDNTNEPSVIVEYKESRGAIRVALASIESDKTLIPHLSQRTIDEEGVIKLYHGVSNLEKVSIYEIGVSKSTSFYLHSQDAGDSKWNIIIDVRYPGTTASSLSLGTGSFSKVRQELDGATASEGGVVTGFSYRSSGGVLAIHFSVGGSTEKPVPKAYAEYSDGDLKLVFPDLKKYTVPGDEHTLPGVGLVTVSESGNQVVFTFTQVHDNNFKLDGSLSPNEISFEVKL